jgi:hypothetical protein
MTAGLGLAGALSSATNVHIVAPSVYREAVAEVRTVHSGSYQGAFEWLELDDAKVSRPVPRGLGASDGPWPPDRQTDIRKSD